MIALILTILKIIGISILVILGILIFLLLIILFVPVRYRAKGEYQDKTACIESRATWLLHFITAFAVYTTQSQMHIFVKVFGFTVFDNIKPKKEKTRHKKAKKTKTKSKVSDETGEIQAASIENPNEILSEVCDKEESNTLNEKQEPQEQEAFEKYNIFQKINLFVKKFINILKNIKFTYIKICDTIRKVKADITYYLRLLQLDSTKKAFETCKAQLVKILKKAAPKKYHINAHVGFDDPSITGELLAICGMLYPLHNGNINIEPEFDSVVAEGDFYFKGHINIFTFVQTIFIFMFDKNIKLFIKHLKRSI